VFGLFLVTLPENTLLVGCKSMIVEGDVEVSYGVKIEDIISIFLAKRGMIMFLCVLESS
jgi:hypothetical protein